MQQAEYRWWTCLWRQLWESYKSVPKGLPPPILLQLPPLYWRMEVELGLPAKAAEARCGEVLVMEWLCWEEEVEW